MSLAMGAGVDLLDVGTGPPVVLLHSSVSGNRQWRALIGALEDRHRVLAVNLLGYGNTPPWPARRPQRLSDQAALVHAALAGISEPVALVGHSFGGSVAMRAAVESGDRIRALVLLEPNPFSLLAPAGRHDAFAEICALGDHVHRLGAAGEWSAVAERFADYWLGEARGPACPTTGAPRSSPPSRPTSTSGTP
jgi:pimeloyl-ACP methyl ester carboxylesterase